MSPVPLLEPCRQYRIGKGARSSRAERPAHNRLVGGSNPPGPPPANPSNISQQDEACEADCVAVGNHLATVTYTDNLTRSLIDSELNRIRATVIVVLALLP